MHIFIDSFICVVLSFFVLHTSLSSSAPPAVDALVKLQKVFLTNWCNWRADPRWMLCKNGRSISLGRTTKFWGFSFSLLSWCRRKTTVNKPAAVLHRSLQQSFGCRMIKIFSLNCHASEPHLVWHRRFRPWRRASPAAVCAGGCSAGGAASGGPARLCQQSVAAGGGSSAADPLCAALCGKTRTPAGPRGARPGPSAQSLDSQQGRHLKDGQQSEEVHE